MLFHEIRPFVRFAQRFFLGPSNCGRRVVARDCRLFFLQSGSSEIELDGVLRPLEPGASVYVPAGTPYTIAPSGVNDHWFYIVNFDFTWAHSRFTQSLPVLHAGASGEIFTVPALDDASFFAQPLFFSQIPELETLLQSMEREFTQPRMLSAAQLSAQMTEILVHLARAQLTERDVHPQAVDTMIRFMQEHFAQPLTNEDIARSVSYHPNYANQLFLRHTGRTLHQFLLSHRIQQALTLLLSTDLSVTEVAARTGFSSLSQFTKQFTAHTGNPPSHYKLR